MAKQGRVLVVDDEERWRELLTEILQRNDFYVDSAPDAIEALEKLKASLFHILILDIRLVENSPANIDGMDLLIEMERLKLKSTIKVVMLSAYGTKERVRDLFEGFGITRFLFKEEFEESRLLDTIKRVLNEDMRINLALDMHWQWKSKIEQAVLNLKIDGKPIKPHSDEQKQMAFELDDLLRRLFPDAERIVIRPTPGGRSGASVLRIQPSFDAGGVGNEVILKFGERRTIEEEYNNFRAYVQPFIGGGRTTTVLQVKHTPQLGGIVYSLLGTSNDKLMDFATFYQQASLTQIKLSLGRLFQETCKSWYSNHKPLRQINLIEEYQRPPIYPKKRLEQIISRHIQYMPGRRKFAFHSLNQEYTFTNPLLVMDGLSIVLPTYLCTTHGDFNQHNLLVDSTGYIWLIDFQGTGESHILRDVAMLDAVVRFQLLPPGEASLEERWQMEEALCSAQHFSQVHNLARWFTTPREELAKAYAVVLHLRALAHQMVELSNNDDISEYYIALLYSALNSLCFSSLQPVQREHAFLSASLLADRLGLSSN